ncbi:hypothetical protein ADK41_37175 [Streptomyces caelestis]|uniref:Uncharacterized protein n=1 Tax=Streptomyces caelestis TaxID=36816 RepID=A0A0M8QCX5_9ACTN|nr:hypothetical protein ADK41_37175 [Streptomyces caelestis]KOV18654.1 hypothetical protein ADK58_36700 [Streptomyces sp. XY152]
MVHLDHLPENLVRQLPEGTGPDRLPGRGDEYVAGLSLLLLPFMGRAHDGRLIDHVSLAFRVR